MVLGFSQAKTDDVTALIAKKNYAKAIEVIKNQLKGQRPDPRLRLQLGDVLAMAGKVPEAINILQPLADEFAREGFAAKAISILKKIQKLDPNRRDVDAKLASVIEQKQRQATVTLPTPPSGMEIGMEEIGFDLPIGGSLSVPAEPGPAPELPSPVLAPEPPPPAPVQVDGPEALDLGLESGPELSLESDAPALGEAPPEELPLPDVPATEDLSLPGGEAEPVALPLEPMEEPSAPPPAPVVDRDLFIDDGIEITEEDEEVPALEIVEDEAPSGEPMTEGLFAAELLSLVEDAFKDVPAGDEGLAPPPGVEDEAAAGGSQIVVSPLFKDLSVDELVDVIQGLNLLTFERGNVIIREGEPGNSLYMLTAGTVKAFVKRDGKQAPISELSEGAFFGEVSMLTGKPRTATIVATTHCELLELDRPTLDSIAGRHPHVMDVLRQFAQERTRRA